MDIDSAVQMIHDSAPSWIVLVGDTSVCPDEVEIKKGTIPVKKPSVRGGVYFTQTSAYKIRCVISDVSIVSRLSSLMLGPSTDFTPIRFTAKLENSEITLEANLTNYVQTKQNVVLNLVIVGLI